MRSGDAVYLYEGKLPGGLKNAGGVYSKPAVNGTWTETGTKWTDVTNRISVPFTCAGRVDVLVQPPGMQLSWKARGSRLLFTVRVLQQELANHGSDACPPDNEATWLQATDPAVFETTFSLPAGDVGRKTFSAPVSGPLAKNREFFLENCPTGAGSDCSLAWQGTVHFTRTKVTKIGY